MPHYIKACPICFSQFYTERIGQVYCRRTCRNKARNFPDKLMESLLEKANRATRVVTTIPKAVREFMLKHKDDYVTPATTQSRIAEEHKLQKSIEPLNIDRLDQETIIKEAMALKRQREVDRIEKEIQKEKTTELTTSPDLPTLDELKNSGFVDPEMVGFNLDQEVKDNLKFIYTTDQANGNADGFGVGSDGVIKNEVLPQPRVSKLRRVGEK